MKGFGMPKQLVGAFSLLFLALGQAAAQTDDGSVHLVELYDYFAPSGAPQEAQLTTFEMQASSQHAPPDAPPPACDEGVCCFDACRFPCVYAQADGLFWHRVGVGCNQVAVIDTATGA